MIERYFRKGEHNYISIIGDTITAYDKETKIEGKRSGVGILIIEDAGRFILTVTLFYFTGQHISHTITDLIEVTKDEYHA
jgi:hypothetical protein